MSRPAAASRVKLFFDGGCRPNPGAMEAAVVACGRTWLFPDLGPGSSERAEWAALLKALEVAEGLALSDVLLLGDSRAVVGQANGTLQSRGAPLDDYRERAARFERVAVRHVGRKQNLAGIALERARAGLTSGL